MENSFDTNSLEYSKYFKPRKKKYAAVLNDLAPPNLKWSLQTIAEKLECKDLEFVNFLAKDFYDEFFAAGSLEVNHRQLNYQVDLLKVDYFYNEIESAVMKNNGSTLSELGVKLLDEIKSTVRKYLS